MPQASRSAAALSLIPSLVGCCGNPANVRASEMLHHRVLEVGTRIARHPPVRQFAASQRDNACHDHVGCGVFGQVGQPRVTQYWPSGKWQDKPYFGDDETPLFRFEKAVAIGEPAGCGVKRDALVGVQIERRDTVDRSKAIAITQAAGSTYGSKGKLLSMYWVSSLTAASISSVESQSKSISSRMIAWAT